VREASRIFDVVVIGAGPGGIAAAVTAAEAGKTVALVDDAPFSGGQIWRNRGETPRLPGAGKWFRRLASVSIARFQQARVVLAPSRNELLAETPTGPLRLRWTALVLATGARELFIPFPGWTTPGVFGAGAIQALIKTGLPVEGRRVVIGGSGPLLLAVADLLRAKGAIVPLIIEQAPRNRINQFGMSLLATPAKLIQALGLRARLLRTRYATNSVPMRVAKTDGGLRVEYKTGDVEHAANCDYFACGFNLIPNNELPQFFGCALTTSGHVRVDHRLRTNVTDVYAIGELTGIGGVEKALVEGELAALAIVGDEIAASALEPACHRAIDFMRRLDAAFALRPEVLAITTPNTIICRCEDVPLSAVRQSLNGRDAKLQTRCGMGPCQGRVCGPALQRLLGSEPPQVRPPVLPVSIRTLAAAGSIGHEFDAHPTLLETGVNDATTNQ
jgi:D-hydroxyproline dehydrogenase subunit alpha